MSRNEHGVWEIARALGLRIRAQDVETLSHWIAERLREDNLSGIGQYAELLAGDGAAARRECELLTAQITSGESYFFRDQGQFDLLAAKILPELIERRASERSLRIWSAGCAAGQEAYSLAMLVDELAPRLAGWNVLILGTDINSKTLEQARRGAYGDWSFRALDETRKQRYFRSRGDHWQIDQHLRNMVSFRRLDLIRDRIPDPDVGLNDLDLIVCRNVFIYLDPHAVSRITAKFGEALADGGILITGHSELFGHDTTPLRVRMFPESAVFQKSAQRAAETGLGESLRKAQPSSAASFLQTPVVAQQMPRFEQPAIAKKPPAPPIEDCDLLVQTAWRHADRGRPDEAEENCRKAIAIAAFDPRPYFLLAQLAQERGDSGQAKSLLNKAIYLDPSFIAAYLELGALHARAGDKDRSRRMYETARTALAKLPAKAAVAPYGESNATDILAYVERLLGAPAAVAAGATAETAPLRRST